MDPASSESDQDGGATSGEDNSFERSNLSNSGHSEPDGQFAEQNPSQLPYQSTNASVANPENYAGMMIASSYLPFMMQQSYQSAMQSTSSAAATTSVPYVAANPFFFNQNLLAKDAEGLAATAGSPLNLQMAGGGQTDRPRIASGHGNFNGGATVQQQQHGLPAESPSPGLQHAHASPHVIAGSSYASPAHQPAPSAYAGVTPINSLPGQVQFPGDVGYAKTDGAAKPTEYPPPPKRPLTPYMRFNRFVSILLQKIVSVIVCVCAFLLKYSNTFKCQICR